ncbi:MAG: beta-agarase [Thermoguttaceae bacterium]|nr:beta-agarase [Thermoguttaceae bacterium]
MLKSGRRSVAIMSLAVMAMLLPAAGTGSEREPKRLIAFDEHFDPGTVETTDAVVAREDASLRITTGRKATWPGIVLPAPEGRWDLRGFGHVAADVENHGEHPVRAHLRVDNPGADGSNHCVTGNVEVAPGRRETLRVPLRWTMPEDVAERLFGMRGYPNGWTDRGGIDPGNVVQVLFFVSKPSQEHTFSVSNLRAAGTVPNPAPSDPASLLPMIDRYGQFLHTNWPGKLHDDADFPRRIEAEAADLAAHPGPEQWNRFGGWLAGPQLEATGFFRTEKHGGKWWLVDPEGRLFWSHGATGVRSTTAHTPITDREHLFAWLPAADSRYAVFYGRGHWAPHGYYQGRGEYRTLNFTGMNLLRKYGDDWAERFADLAHRRLRSWGMNTIANWSDRDIYLMRRTPYTATIGTRGRVIEGSSGYWGKFPDPFDPSLRESIRAAMAAQRDRSAGDPWCIGYFVGNELSWGDELSLAVAALTSPADQPAKLAVVDELKRKYGTIERLNAAWQTEHASWDALARSTDPPDRKTAGDDLAALYTLIAEEFFRVCRDEVKAAAPHSLYLGCRFAWRNDRAVRASARFCDVVSINVYGRSVADLALPEGVDMPVVIGEFHFGALDRGMLHTGLVPTGSQEERADAYRSYVEGALDNPCIVGTHWFQFGDQATTGRGDGENYQIGLLNVCDTPYPEIISALRDVGAAIYRRRMGEPSSGR